MSQAQHDSPSQPTVLSPPQATHEKMRNRTDTAETADVYDVYDSPATKSETTLNKFDLKNFSLVQSMLECWGWFINTLRFLIIYCMKALSGLAARNPYQCILFVAFQSIFLLACGLYTNFHLEVDPQAQYAPYGSLYVEHDAWLRDAGYPQNPRDLILLLHADGDNVLGEAGVRRVFEAVDTIRAIPGYDDICSRSNYVDMKGRTTCFINSITGFWNDDVDVFESQVSSDKDPISTMSADSFPNGMPINLPTLMSYSERDLNGTLTSARSYIVTFRLPESRATVEFEKLAVEKALELSDLWDNGSDDTNNMQLEIMAQRSMDDESTRAIMKDIPLFPMVFIIMVSFTCLIFRKHDKVKSRSLLGCGAVVCILLAIITAFGTLFIAGVPLSSSTQLVLFVIFGIGLDDTFILMGAYIRADHKKDLVQRIDDVIEEVGLSITMTTTTTAVAFGLGSMTSIPAMRWFGYYALACIIVVFLYQTTLFIAILVLDEQRIQSRRIDCCICFIAQENTNNNSDCDGQKGVLPDKEENKTDKTCVSPGELMIETAMDWYATQLLRPRVKMFVLFVFTAFFCGSAYSSTLLTQEFKLSEILPGDSYALNFLKAFDKYGTKGWFNPGAYFRDVDQSDPDIQEQMEDFVNNLVDSVDAIEGQPKFFWLRDFKKFQYLNPSARDMTFNEQLDSFLSIPVVNQIYGDHIVRDDDGNVLSSRVILHMNNVDMDIVEEQIRALNEQYAVSRNQTINNDVERWKFFTLEYNYFTWEFLAATEREIVLTTIISIIAVSSLSLLFMPHWTAALFVFPILSVLYVDLLGTLQFAGLSLNAVTYITLVMSIGILVDFIMHFLLRYYESTETTRDGKIKDSLKSIGVSIVLGGLSTFLGVVPLAFSVSSVMKTVFTSFVATILLGCSHGLIFLPVVLSYVGPLKSFSSHSELPQQSKSSSSNDSVSKPSDLEYGTAKVSFSSECESQTIRAEGIDLESNTLGVGIAQ